MWRDAPGRPCPPPGSCRDDRHRRSRMPPQRQRCTATEQHQAGAERSRGQASGPPGGAAVSGPGVGVGVGVDVRYPGDGHCGGSVPISWWLFGPVEVAVGASTGCRARVPNSAAVSAGSTAARPPAAPAQSAGGHRRGLGALMRQAARCRRDMNASPAVSSGSLAAGLTGSSGKSLAEPPAPMAASRTGMPPPTVEGPPPRLTEMACSGARRRKTCSRQLARLRPLARLRLDTDRRHG